jgi:hypothetical protein
MNLQEQIEQEARLAMAKNNPQALGGLQLGGLGGSPIPPLEQGRLAAKTLLDTHLKDRETALNIALTQYIKDNWERYGTEPQWAQKDLITLLQSCLDPATLTELTRRADFLWGQLYGEKPIFERAGQQANPEDPYTWASVTQQINHLIQQLKES